MALGYKHSEETRKKMSLNHSSLSAWNKGNKLTDETKDKIRKSHYGIKPNKEAIEKMSEAHTGKHHSQETKDKIREANSGSKSYHWKGGRQRAKYSVDWTNTLRISIRERDHYTCKICWEKQGDRAFSVHHIDYNKFNCNINNLITLCVSCHTKTNFNKEKWINYFKEYEK